MSKKRKYLWCLIEFIDGQKVWYCVSRVLREAVFAEKKQNQFWKKTLIGNYITVAISAYNMGIARLTVGKIKKVRILTKRPTGHNWTRNQFVTPAHLLDFKSAYNYLRHDYKWYNRFAIWIALKYWHNELIKQKIKEVERTIKHKRWKINHRF